MLSPSRKMVPTSPLFPVETEHCLRAVLQVRIHLAPAESLQTVGSSRRSPHTTFCGNRGRATGPVEQPDKFELVINLKTAQAARPDRPALDPRPRRGSDRMSNCLFRGARLLIVRAASRLALCATSLRSAAALTRPARWAWGWSCGRHGVPASIGAIGPLGAIAQHGIKG